METIAVYWEKSVKTYGFCVETGLCLIRAPLAIAEAGDAVRALADLSGGRMPFKLVLFNCCANGRSWLHLLLGAEWRADAFDFFKAFTNRNPGFSCQVEEPVEMLYFHGPHFGDRHGIAHQAARMLRQRGIRLLAMGCAGSCVHLILPKNSVKAACDALGGCFLVP